MIDCPDDLVIPPIFCPFPTRLHADAARIERHLLTWAQRYGLLRSTASTARFRQTRFGEFIARIHPSARNLTDVGEWAAFLFFFDDQFDDGTPDAVQHLHEVSAQLMTAMPVDLESVPPASNPLVAATGDLWRRMAPRTSRQWRLRFVTDVEHYIKSYACDIAVQRHAEPPELEPYLEFRRRSGAMLTALDLAEVTDELRLPDELVFNPLFVDVREAVNDIVCWTNDIMSVRKEVARGEYNNLVLVLRATSSSWSEAAEQAAGMVAERVGDFQRLRARLEDLPIEGRARREVHGWAEGMEYWIAGSLAWHLSSPRYSDIEHTPPGIAPGYLDPLLLG